MGKKRSVVLFGLAAVLMAGFYLVRPVVIRTDETTRLAVLLRHQTGEIRFVNSVTGGPVEIRFAIGDRFKDFSIHTDETTEAYYSHGVYDLGEALAAEATASLKFCSMKGIALRLGFFTSTIQDGCLEAEVLWTM